LRGAGIVDHRNDLGINDGLENRQQHIRPDEAGDEIDLVGFDQLLNLLDADFRLLLVIFIDDLDRQSAELAAEVVETKLESIAHVVADQGARSTECVDVPDLDRLFLSGGGERRQRNGHRGNQCSPDHRNVLRLAHLSVCGAFSRV
jgi:hypothetical protein